MPGFRDLSCLGLFGVWRSRRVVERILLSCCLWYPLVVRTPDNSFQDCKKSEYLEDSRWNPIICDLTSPENVARGRRIVCGGVALCQSVCGKSCFEWM